MNRFSLVVSLVAVSLLALSSSALAYNDPPDPQAETPVSSPESGGGLPGTGDTRLGDSRTTFERTASQTTTIPAAVPIVPAADVPGSTPVGSSSESGAAPGPASGPACVRHAVLIYDADGEYVAGGECIAWEACGSERVDDVRSGDINGESPGHYASFLGEVFDGFFEDDFTVGAGISTVSDLLVEIGLTQERDPGAIPVFGFCAEADSAGLVSNFVLGSISLAWTLDADDVYDVPGIAGDLFDQLKARFDLYDPQIGLVPRAELGYTFVQWPTWLYLENLLASEGVFTTNDTDTFRVDLRATLLRLDWHHGDELLLTCTSDELRVFDPDLHDPVADRPSCSHVFTQLATEDLVATIVYLVEEDVRTAPFSGEYPPLQWSPYLGAETVIDLDSVIPDFEVHEILALNAAPDTTVEEIRANLGELQPGR